MSTRVDGLTADPSAAGVNETSLDPRNVLRVRRDSNPNLLIRLGSKSRNTRCNAGDRGHINRNQLTVAAEGSPVEEPDHLGIGRESIECLSSPFKIVFSD